MTANSSTATEGGLDTKNKEIAELKQNENSKHTMEAYKTRKDM